MTSGAPWQVEGIGAEARETAREAARRSGMSVGEWLDSMISDQARSETAEPSPSNASDIPPGHGDIADVKGRLDQVGRQLDQLSRLNAGQAYLRPSLREDGPMRGVGDAISQLDQRLDQLMKPAGQASEAAAARPGAGAPPSPALVTQPSADRTKSLEQALAQIAERQRALHADSEAPAGPARRAETPPPAPAQDLSNLEQQLRNVTTKVEAMRPCGVNEAVETLRDDLAEIGLMLKEAMPRQAIEALEAEVRGLSERLHLRASPDTTENAIAGIERGLAEVRDALRALTPAESLVGVEETVRELSRKMERLVANAEDPASMDQLEGAIVGLRGIATHVASDGALAKLSDDVRGLAARVEEIASSTNSGADLLSTLEQRLAVMAQALDGRPQAGVEAAPPADLDAIVRGITERLAELRRPHSDEAAFENLEGRISGLVERLDSSNARFDHLEAIERGLADMMADLERQRQSDIERIAAKPAPEVTSLRQDVHETRSSLETMQSALEQLVNRLAVIEGDMRSPAMPSPQAPVGKPAEGGVALPTSSPLRAAAPAVLPPTSPAAEHRPIDPSLPPDHPLEPGATRGRGGTSPADRIAASEAALGAAKPPVAAEAGSKSNFIAAARRAAQAANSEGGSEKRAPAPAADKTARPKSASSWGSRVRSVLVAVSVVLIVLSSVHLVVSLFASSDDPSGGAQAPNIQSAPKTDDAPQAPATTPVPGAPTPAPPPGRQSMASPGDGDTVRAVPPQETAQPAAVAAPPLASSDRDVTGSISPATTAATPAAIMPEPPAIAAAHTVRIDKLPASIGGALRSAAAKGDAAAEYEIAQRYADGHGVPENLAEAAEWYDRAAKQGLPIAQFRLGGFYEKGFGVTKDLDMARRLYTAAADAGNAKAMHNLAVLYAEGIDGKPDYQNAAKWFRKAADYGLTDSQYNLGILYGRGIGMPVNLPEAYKWFALAARDGDRESASKRDDVGGRMDAQSLAAAKAAVAAFSPMEQPDAATQTGAPPGGWDNLASAAPANAKPRTAATKSDRSPAPH